MAYEMKAVPSVIRSGRVEWSCPCGSQFSVAFSVHASGIGYETGGYVEPVTGGVGVGCSTCQRRYFLGCVATEPAVEEVIEVREPEC